MCLATKPKVAAIPAPAPAPPPPADTATALKEAGTTRASSDLSNKRKGRSALLISRPIVTGIQSPSSGSGLQA